MYNELKVKFQFPDPPSAKTAQAAFVDVIRIVRNGGYANFEDYLSRKLGEPVKISIDGDVVTVGLE